MTQNQSIKDRWDNMYFGWKTVIAGAIIACWGYGSWYYGMGALLLPLTQEFGWTRTQLTLAFSMRSIEGGLEGPIGGWLIDRYGERKITIISTIIACVGLVAVLYVKTIWQFVIVWGFIVSLGFNLGLYDTVNSAVAKWFHRDRSRAIGIVTIGGGLGAPVIVPIMAFIIQDYGWRSALIFVIVSTAALCIPLAWFFMKDHPPEFYGMLPDGDHLRVKEGEEPTKVDYGYDFTPKEALKTKSFWMMLVAFMLNGGTLAMITIHQMAFHQSLGIDALAAAGILGLMATISLGGRFLTVTLGNKYTERQYIMLGYTLRTIGLVIFIYARTIPIIMIFALFYGVGYGITIPSQTSLRANYFGRKAYATITGYTTMFGAITNVAYPVFAAWIYDTTGSYIQAFWIVTALQAFAIVFMYLAKKPEPPIGVVAPVSI
ncbi:MFS transporter [Candidatus Bathyarchaeota archaeon]|jgi:MFS transporter, OFA family, oxalate/formate antiporter|nr:MFS transporter [Candidatus Bathyarchaeota archaeon]MBT4321230.1 MFS transporter [Candidatus Bathyarchaeota archaeon]MBT4423617.1 MFS transporter [Candidatus Bathyarchaeota archaeon]MBT5641478.1 MFS transporter [Candidatus Bathyarchaeota archaeon]MBT6605822.1 MFS transporter [Candidatus Bathyarchaeota archaeon]